MDKCFYGNFHFVLLSAEFQELKIIHFKLQNIRENSETYAREKNLTVEESKKAQNRKLNRYRDVNPYDYSRIVLQKGIGGSDYINANIVKV